MPKRASSQRHRSARVQALTPSTAGSGPFRITAASAAVSAASRRRAGRPFGRIYQRDLPGYLRALLDKRSHDVGFGHAASVWNRVENFGAFLSAFAT